MFKTRTLFGATCLVAMLSMASSASLLSGFFGPPVPTFFRDDIMGLDSRSILRSMHQMEKMADGILSHVLEDNCAQPSSACTKKNATATEEQGLSTLRSLQMRPRFDLQETGDGVVLTAFTPGLRKEELIVEVVENDNIPFLIIAGESNNTLASSEGDEKSSIAGMKLPYQASYAKFERRIRIPPNVDRKTIKADYQDGMLTVTMSRVALPAPQKQTILIQ